LSVHILLSFPTARLGFEAISLHSFIHLFLFINRISSPHSIFLFTTLVQVLNDIFASTTLLLHRQLLLKMKTQFFALVALGPLAAYALPKGQRKCGKPRPSPTASTTIVTTGLPLSDFPGFSTAPVENLPTVTTYSTDSITPSAAPAATTTVTTGLPLTDFPGFTYVPPESLPTVTTYSTDSIISSAEPLSTTVTTGLPLTDFPGFTYVPPESLPAVTTYSTDSIAPTATASATVDAAFGHATPISYKVAAKQQCGNDDHLILPGMPWTVANSMYNGDRMVGKQCTNFEGVLQGNDGVKEVKWNSTTDIEFVEETKDLCKGYTNIGVGVNLNNRLKDIKSIPAYFQWDRTNTTAFRGESTPVFPNPMNPLLFACM
jgi:hypothetical protein